MQVEFEQMQFEFERHTMAEPEKLWSKTLVALICINFINVLVFYLLVVELVGYSTDTYGVSKTLAALPNTAYIVSALVARVVFGRQVDQWGPMKSLIIGMILNAAACIGYLLPFGFVWLNLMRVVHGVGLALQSAAAVAGAILTMPKSRRAEGVGYYSLGQALGMGVGPFIAVLLMSNFEGYSVLFIFSAVMMTGSLLFLTIVRLPKIEQPEREEGARIRIGDLIQLEAVPISCVIAMAFFCYAGVSSFIVEYAASENFTTISFFFLLYSVVVVILRPLAGKRVDRVGENSLVYPTLSALVIGLLMVAFAPNGAVFLVSAAFVGIGVGVTQSVIQAVVAREAPAAEQGRANSTFLMGLDTGMGIGPIVLGAVLGFVSYRQMYFGLAVFAALAIVLYFFVHGRKAAQRNR